MPVFLLLIKSRFLYFGDRQRDKQTDEQMDSVDALSRSGCRERRLNNGIVNTNDIRWWWNTSNAGYTDKKRISIWDRRTLPPEPRHCCKTLPLLRSIFP